MERMTRFRAGFLLCIFFAVLCFYGFRLYKVQVVDTGGDKNNITTFTTLTRVKAPRGNILDRNGNVLVTNRASYDLTINHYVLTSSADPNGTLYELVKLCQARGIEYVDHLPLTLDQPFAYTLDQQNQSWQNNFQAFLIYRDDLDSDISAPLLMQKLRESYDIPPEWSDRDARAVLGLRYELTLRFAVNSLSTYVFLSDVDNETLAAVLELNIPGMRVESSSVREYTTEYAAHILGYVGAMNAKQWEHYKTLDGYSMDALVGQTGLEEAFEEYLHGIDGTRVDKMTKDGTLIESYYKVEPQAGQNVQVSIDLELQTAAEETLKLTIEGLRGEEGSGKGWDAQGAAVVAMDIKTGQVLVCGSYPTYDLSTIFEDFEALNKADLQPMFNRALQAIYPPGSTYKMSMTVAGIESGAIGRWSYIEDKGAFTKYPGMSPKCLVYSSSGRTHGSIEATEALKVSCNYFYYELGDRVSIQDIDDTAKALGLGEATGIELYEAIGYRSNPESKAALYKGDDARWYKGDQILTAIGQAENRFTPMQICNYICTLVNQGTRYKATFLNRVMSQDYKSVVYENAVEVMHQMDMSDEAYQAVMVGMKRGAQESGGTGYSTFKDYPISVASKTGTAQTGIKGHSDNGAFACFAPTDDPQIAVVIYGERAGSGSNLGPVARAVLDAYFGTDAPDDTVRQENTVS